MKRIIRIIAVFMIFSLAVMVAGCSKSETGTETEETETAEEENAGLANPWTEVDSIEAAAQGAGISGFSLAEGITLSLGEVVPSAYRYMEGLAEVEVPVAAVRMIIRKGSGEEDISGDYNVYAKEWTQDVNGIEVKCFGNNEGAATKTIWSLGGESYAVLAYGEGGETDFGLSADDLTTLIGGIM